MGPLLHFDFCHFNSIKVRLELTVLMANRYVIGYFNSIKVRLELCTVIGEGSTSKFQFHKGTIRTESQRGVWLLPSHFNSIKVRLEPELRG